MIGAEASRLADLAFMVSAGKFDELQRILLAQGKTLDITPDSVVIRGGVVSAVGLHPQGCDPHTALVQIMMALFGPVWPMLPFAEAAAQEVQRRWRLERKAVP